MDVEYGKCLNCKHYADEHSYSYQSECKKFVIVGGSKYYCICAGLATKTMEEEKYIRSKD